MTTNRHLRIVAVLADAEGSLGIAPLTKEINERFERTYPPSLINIDLGVLIARRQVMVDEKTGSFSVTEIGRAVDISPLKRKPRWSASQPGQLMAA
jgi:hypothetical protein